MRETGPDYPPPTQAPGIGVPFDVWQTIISQYANSEILTRLIRNLDAYIDQRRNFDNFYKFIWNVDTAQGVGLDIWGRIVGVNRVLNVAEEEYFGFEQASPGVATFGHGPYYSGQTVTNNFRLTDQAYRLLIMAKAAANITNGSIPAINRILMTLFPGRGNCYVTEGTASAGWFGFEQAGDAHGFGQQPFYMGAPITHMTMTYTFEFPLAPFELAIVQQSGVLPKSTGVATSVIIKQGPES